MPDGIQLSLDTKEIRRNIRRLGDREVNRAMAIALNKTAFDVLDAEKAHASDVFEFAGPSTQRFMAGRGSFVFDQAKPENLTAVVYPRERNEKLLIEHQRGATITAAGGGHLKLGTQLAVPIREARIRSARGRVPKRLTPGALLSGKGRGFVAGRALLERRGGQARASGQRRRGGSASRVVALYALIDRAKLAPRFEFYNTARDTARRVFPDKARRAFEKIRVSR